MLADEVIDTMMERIGSITSPFSQISGWAVGGAVTNVDGDATAVGERHGGFELNTVVGWQPGDPEPDRHIRWVRDAWSRAYGDRLTRLTALKDAHDPTNFFRMNANIEPSPGS